MICVLFAVQVIRHYHGHLSRVFSFGDLCFFAVQVIRHYHGHLSGVFALAVHPELPLLMTGGRDSTCRLWDMRSRVQVHCMSGHQSTVATILGHGADPQVRTSGHSAH